MTVKDIKIKLNSRLYNLKNNAILKAQQNEYDKAQYYNQKVLDLYEIMLCIDLLDIEGHLEQTEKWIDNFYTVLYGGDEK